MIKNISINSKSAWNTWGVAMTEDSMDALMLTPAMKEYIESESRLEHGSRVVVDSDTCKVSSRELNLSFFLTGTTAADYLQKYSSFADELQKGNIALSVPDHGKVYHLIYQSGGKYGSYGRCKAKITIRVKEPNPNNRDNI